MDNKFLPVKVGDLSKVEQISIVDEESYKKEKGKVKKKYAFTTTMGNYDADHLNWSAVLEDNGHTDILVIIRRKIV